MKKKNAIKNVGEKLAQRRDLKSVINLLMILSLSLSITLLLTLHADRLPKNILIGEVATKDIKADKNYEIVDEKSTEKRREDALEKVLPVFDFDSSLLSDLQKRIAEAFEYGRLFIAENSLLENKKPLLSEDLEATLKREFIAKLGVVLKDEEYQAIRNKKFEVHLQKGLENIVQKVMTAPIVHDKSELSALSEKGFMMRRLSADEQHNDVEVHDVSSFLSLDQAKRQLAQLKFEDFDNLVGKISREDFRLLRTITDPMLKVNVNYNGLETDQRKTKAKENIKNVIIKIKTGESIIRSGDRFEAWHLSVFKGIRASRLQTNRSLKFLGIFIFVNLLLLLIHHYASKHIRQFRPTRQDLIFLGGSIIFFLAVLRFGVFLGGSIKDAFPFQVDISMLYYAIPIAAGAMVVRSILNAETALIFSVILSLFCGIFLENNLELTVYYLMSSIFAAHSIVRVQKRSTVLLVGAYLGFVNAIIVYSLNLITLISTTINVDPIQVVLNTLSAFCGGIFAAMLLLIIAPIAESIFNYTTDIKLLELANMSHPLLKEMIVKAPGTYHHSQIVGILSEAGAQAIGANPLLCRVSSYYHDIGKMKKPQYFIENQSGYNPHDKLSPSMSALIIEAHVKDGIEMAKEHKLPQKIADMIPEHQGTKLIGYFFKKAKDMEKDGGARIEENDYRYPGPKPQSREAGVIMLADTIEAAVRALPEKSPQKIRSTVEKLVNMHFVDEQLDECDLTLRDIHLIADAFVKILIGIYHQRIEYPEGALHASAKVQDIQDSKVADDNIHQQRASNESNVAPLFKKKD